MCFSANASFIASAVIGSGGVATLLKVNKREQILFGAIPMLFAIQQFTEGVIWVTLREAGKDKINFIATTLYIIFARVLWPTITPLAVYLLETNKVRKKIISAILCIGVSISFYLLACLLYYGYSSEILCCEHIGYVSTIPYGNIVKWIYVAVVSLPFFCFSNRKFALYGFLWFFSFLIADNWYRTTFESVWCFFAAILSITIYLYLKYEKELFTPEPPASGT